MNINQPGSAPTTIVRIADVTGANANVPSTYKSKIVAPNIVNGVNTLMQTMINEANVKYIFRYDFTLGEDITIPEDCVLEFDGGSIDGNHSIIGQNTAINADLVKIFSTNIAIAGSWNIKYWNIKWFGAKGDGVTDDTLPIQKAISFVESVVFFPLGTYVISSTLNGNKKRNKWLGELSTHGFNSTSYGTVIKCVGTNNGEPFIILPEYACNIDIVGSGNTQSVSDDTIGIQLGVDKNNPATYCSYENIRVRFFNKGLSLHSNWGCSFNGFRLQYNNIGISIDGLQDETGTLLSIYNFTISGNFQHAIAKKGIGKFSPRIFFYTGTMESNGETTDGITIFGDSDANYIGYFYFNNVYGEGDNIFASFYNGGISLNNCIFWHTNIKTDYGYIFIVNSDLKNMIIEGTNDYNRINIINSKVKGFSGELNETLSGVGIRIEDAKVTGHVGFTVAKLPAGRKTSIDIPANYGKGYCMFEKSLNKPIWWNGTEWVDATGTPV